MTTPPPGSERPRDSDALSPEPVPGLDARAIDCLAAMVATDSTNPDLVPGGAGEAEIARLIAGWLRDLDLEVRVEDARPGRPNVVARLPGRRPGRSAGGACAAGRRGGGRSLMLNGHTDTVGTAAMAVPPHEPRREGGRLYGRGAFDMKGGLAAMLWAAAALAAGPRPAGDVVWAFVADEEHQSAGTEAVLASVRTDAAVVLEPTGLGLGVAHKGFVWASVETTGRAAHGSRPDLGVDAIAMLGPVLTGIARLDREVLPRRQHPLLGRPSVHASLIRGGQELSSYPDRARLDLEWRTLPGDPPEAVQAALDEIRRKAQAQHPGFQATVRVDFHRPGLETPPDHPVAATLRDAAARVLGMPPPLFGAAYWLDAALLSAAGIPTVFFGTGGEGAHAAVEWVPEADVLRCGRILVEAARAWCE